MTIATRTRVALVDDHRILLDGLARLIDAQPDLEVVGTASATTDAIELRPGAVLPWPSVGCALTLRRTEPAPRARRWQRK